MELVEAKRLMQKIYTQLQFTKSQKVRNDLIGDIINIERLILAAYQEVVDGIDFQDTRMKQFRAKVKIEQERKLAQAIDCYDINQNVTQQLFADFLHAEYIPQFRSPKPFPASKYLDTLFAEFMQELGPLFAEKYQSMLEHNQISIIEPTPLFTGLCLNFTYTDAQEILVGNYRNNILTNQILAHEMGHAVHMGIWNHTRSKLLDFNIFAETIANLIEWLFLVYLEKSGVNTSISQRTYIINLLFDALLLFEYSAANDHDEAYIYGRDIIADLDTLRTEDFINQLGLNNYYDFIFKEPSFISATTNFWSRFIAFAMIDKYGKEAPSKTLDFLFIADHQTQEESLNSLDIQETPAYLMRTLEKLK